jgi:hypothetical protein
MHIIPLVIVCPGAYDKSTMCPMEPLSWIWLNCKHDSFLDEEGFVMCK